MDTELVFELNDDLIWQLYAMYRTYLKIPHEPRCSVPSSRSRREVQVRQVPWRQAESSNDQGRARAWNAQPAGTGRLRGIAASLVIHLEQPNLTPRFLRCRHKRHCRGRADF